MSLCVFLLMLSHCLTQILILLVVCCIPSRTERNYPILAAFCLQVLWRCRADAAHAYSHTHRRQQNLWYVLSSLVLQKVTGGLSTNRASILFLTNRIYRAGGAIFATVLSRERRSRSKRDATDFGRADRTSVYTSFDHRIPKRVSRLPLHQRIQGARSVKHG